MTNSSNPNLKWPCGWNTMSKHGNYDYISDWCCCPEPHVLLAMTT